MITVSKIVNHNRIEPHARYKTKKEAQAAVEHLRAIGVDAFLGEGLDEMGMICSDNLYPVPDWELEEAPERPAGTWRNGKYGGV